MIGPFAMLRELRRRHIFRGVGFYLVGAWGVIAFVTTARAVFAVSLQALKQFRPGIAQQQAHQGVGQYGQRERTARSFQQQQHWKRYGMEQCH